MLKIKIIEENDARLSKIREGVPNAMFVKPNEGGSQKKGKFKKPGGKPRSDPKDDKHSKSIFPYKCHRSFKVGHKAQDCEEVINKRSQKASMAEELSFLLTLQNENALSAEQFSTETRWCLDSGCTSHMTREEKLFVNKSQSDTMKLNLVSHASTMVLGKGTVKLSVSNGPEEKILQLDDTLHVP